MRRNAVEYTREEHGRSTPDVNKSNPERCTRPLPLPPLALSALAVMVVLTALLVLTGCVPRQGPAARESAPVPSAVPPAVPQPAAACPPPAGGTPTPECAAQLAAVTGVVNALVATRNAHDAEALLQLYAPDAGIMTWLSGEDRDAVVTRLRYAAMLPEKTAKWRQRGRTHSLLAGPVITVSGTTARAEFDMLVQEGADKATGHYTLVLHRQENDWLIFRETYAQLE